MATARMATFSIIIPTRDRPHYLREAVESVLAQTRKPEEIIVVDDGRGAAEGLGDMKPIVRILDNRQSGPVAARNLGVASAKGECIAFLDDDDWFTDPNYLTNIGKQFDQGASFCFGNGRLVYEDGRVDLPFEFGANAKSLESDNTILISAVSYHRSLHERLGKFDEDLPYYWDWDWYLRVARSGIRLYHHARSVVAIRVHGENMSGAAEQARRANLDALARKHGLSRLELKSHRSIAEDERARER